ncbi:hypothetical protein [Ruminococcus sp.]|uniref:hypothetical protein n=1 Tax=Ruminococcus sp. TaxID=41978 RepID=UPI003AB85239
MYDVNKLLQLAHLKATAEKIAAECASKAEVKKLSNKVDNLITTGGEPNKLEGVKVNGVALAIADKMVDLLIASGTENGTVKVNNVDIPIKGLAALAYKAQVSKEDLDTALTLVLDGKAEQTALDAVKGDVDTLKGAGEGSVKKQIDDAINEFANNITEDGVVNSFKELVDWAATHGSEAAEMAASITAVKNLVGTLPEDANSDTVVEYITEVVNALKAEVTTSLSKKVNAVEGSRLMTNAEGEKLGGIAENATKVEKSDTNGNVKVNGVETVVYTLPEDVIKGKVATSEEVTEMLNEVFVAQ